MLHRDINFPFYPQKLIEENSEKENLKKNKNFDVGSKQTCATQGLGSPILLFQPMQHSFPLPSDPTYPLFHSLPNPFVISFLISISIYPQMSNPPSPILHWEDMLFHYYHSNLMKTILIAGFNLFSVSDLQHSFCQILQFRF